MSRKMSTVVSMALTTPVTAGVSEREEGKVGREREGAGNRRYGCRNRLSAASRLPRGTVVSRQGPKGRSFSTPKTGKG